MWSHSLRKSLMESFNFLELCPIPPIYLILIAQSFPLNLGGSITTSTAVASGFYDLKVDQSYLLIETQNKVDRESMTGFQFSLKF